MLLSIKWAIVSIRLEEKLDDDYLLWYDVPVGPKQTHPDLVIIHLRRGLLILDFRRMSAKVGRLFIYL